MKMALPPVEIFHVYVGTKSFSITDRLNWIELENEEMTRLFINIDHILV